MQEKHTLKGKQKLSNTCPICQKSIKKDDRYKIVNNNMDAWPSEPPLSIKAHQSCINLLTVQSMGVSHGIA